MSCDIGICCAPCPHLVACNDMTGGRAHIVLPSRNLKRGAMKKPTKLLRRGVAGHVEKELTDQIPANLDAFDCKLCCKECPLAAQLRQA